MSDRVKGIACILASAFGFALMAFFVRYTDEIGSPVSAFQKSFFRNSVAFFVALVVFFRARHGVSPGGKKGTVPAGKAQWATLLIRSAVGTAGIFANFYALGKIPIADCQALNKTAPFFTVLFAWWFLGEKMSARQLLAMAVAMAGSALVMRPEFGGSVWAGAVALFGGIAAGGAYAAVRKLGTMKVDGAFIVLFFSAFSTVAALPFIAAEGWDPMSRGQTLSLAAAGAAAALGQFGITLAYRFAEPRSIAIFDYSNIIFTALLGALLLGQMPDAYSLGGFAVIILAAASIYPPRVSRI